MTTGKELDACGTTEGVVKPQERLKMGDALVALGARVGVTDDEAELMNRYRDKNAAEPMRID